MDDKNYYKEGSHLIRRVVKLPPSGSTNYLYTLIEDNLSVYYRWFPDKTWERIVPFAASGGATFLQEGTNVTITGVGTEGDHYIISSSDSDSDDQMAIEVPITTISGLMADNVQNALEEIKTLIPEESTTDLSLANRDISTLDILSSSGEGVTLPEATTTLSGLMSGTDKSKLDALPDASEIPSISTVKVTLSSAQVLGLNTVPIQIIDTPTTGKFIQLLGVSFNVKNGSTVFLGGVGELRFSSQGIDTQLQFVSADGALISGNTFSLAVPVSSTDDQLVESVGIQVATSTPITQGNGTVDIYATYQTITI